MVDPFEVKSVAMFAVVALVACRRAPDRPDLGPRLGGVVTGGPRPAALVINPRLLRRFKPVRTVLDGLAQSTPAQVDLGRELFFDPRLARDRDLSCNSCHALDRYGVDNSVTSMGHGGRRGERNAPSVYHAAGHIAQFWDGRAADVEDQAGQPILNPAEMAMPDRASVVARLERVPGYVTGFHAAFPGDAVPITFEHVSAAIGAFERGLVTPARWDAYLEGDTTALTGPEIQGFKLFADIGCVDCHTGEFLGGSMFRKLGVAEAWPDQHDVGREAVTSSLADQMTFKVPSLRNVARTAPYFHDGSAATLDEAVREMGHYQVGVDLTPREVKLITTWLASLTGALPTAYIARPALPPDPTVGVAAAR